MLESDFEKIMSTNLDKKVKFPKFTLANNYDDVNSLFIIHSDYPSFILNDETKEIKFFHYLNDDEKTSETTKKLIDNALAWAEFELEKYANDEEL